MCQVTSFHRSEEDAVIWRVRFTIITCVQKTLQEMVNSKCHTVKHLPSGWRLQHLQQIMIQANKKN